MVAPLGACTRIPVSCAAPEPSTALNAPISSRIREACGLMYSEHGLSRGNWARSRIITSRPARAMKYAADDPAGPPPTTIACVSRMLRRQKPVRRARDPLEKSHVLPVRPGKPENRCGSRQVRKNRRTRVRGKHEPRVIRGEPLETNDGRIEIEPRREIKRRVEQGVVGCDASLGHRDAMKRRSRIDTQPDSEIDRIAALETPFREVERFLQCLARFTGTAYKKNPQSSYAGLLHALCNFAHPRRRETLLELLEHGIARTFCSDAERLEAGAAHGGEKLGRRCGRREVRRVQMHAHLPSRYRFAHLQRVTRRRIESRVHEIKVCHTCGLFQLLDLVCNQFRRARSVAPAFDIPVSTVDAFEDAPALGLDRSRRAVALVSLQVDPPVERRRGKGIEVCILAGRGEMHTVSFRSDKASERRYRLASRERIYECNAGALPIAGDCVVDTEISEERFRGDSECRPARNHLGLRCSLSQRVKNRSRLRCVMPKRDGVAVVDVANRNADHGRAELAGRFVRSGNRVALEAKIQKADFVSGCVERRSDARETVRNNREGLALAISAHEQHPSADRRNHRRVRGRRGKLGLSGDCDHSLCSRRDRYASTSPVTAPVTEPTALTTSLSTQRRPPCGRVVVPQLCRSRSVARPQ